MQSNPPPIELQISRLIPQSSNRNYVTELALQCSYSLTNIFVYLSGFLVFYKISVFCIIMTIFKKKFSLIRNYVIQLPMMNDPIFVQFDFGQLTIGADYSAIGQQGMTSIPQFSNYCYYGELKPQAGYLGPEIGWRQQEHFQYHHPPPHHLDMRVITEREIEKEHIRQEIIRLDIARRHVLEAEVRRVLMMEREPVPQRGSNGFPFSSLRTLLFESLMTLPCSVSRVEERLVLVDMIAKLLEERERLNGMRETGRLDTFPFQRGTSHLKISEVKPAMHEDNKKERIILLPKPDDNASGSKREAETLDGFMKKKAKIDWSCAVCKFSASSERQLNEHLQGRKHKNEESKMRRAKKGCKNYRIGLSSIKATKCKSTAEYLAFSETQVGSLKKDRLPSLPMSLNSHYLMKNEPKLDPNIRMGEKPMKKRRRAHKSKKQASRNKKQASWLRVVERNRGAGQRMIPATIKEPQQL